MTDRPRYVFAKLDGTGWYAADVTDVPAPSPEDWQAIVDAVEAWKAIPTLAGGKKGARWHDVASLAVAAVRNMREAEG